MALRVLRKQFKPAGVRSISQGFRWKGNGMPDEHKPKKADENGNFQNQAQTRKPGPNDMPGKGNVAPRKVEPPQTKPLAPKEPPKTEPPKQSPVHDPDPPEGSAKGGSKEDRNKP
jgi:hypothetical protein